MSLRDEILNNPACAAALEARDLDELARIASLNRVTVQSRFITARTILAECGMLGSGILDALEAVSAMDSSVKWAVKFLGQDSGLDVGNPVTQYMIDQLALGSALTAEQAASLKNLALQPAPVTRMDVETAIFKAVP